MPDRSPNELASGFETFSDPSYYDMICLRPKGNKNFNETLHFSTEDQAAHASHVITEWCAALGASFQQTS